MADPENPWTRLARRIVYDNPWMRVYEDDVLTPAGTESLYGLVSPKHRALGVLPLHEDGTVTLVGQWRYALEQYSWEAPEGGGALNGDPLGEIKRELIEETGLEAGRWLQILDMHMSNSKSDERAFCWLATGLKEAARPELDDAEADLVTRRIAFAEALDMAVTGTITDAMTVAMLLRAHHMAVTGALEPDLARLLNGGESAR